MFSRRSPVTSKLFALFLTILLTAASNVSRSSSVAARAAAPDVVRVGAFGSSLISLAAQAKGFYARHNLSVQNFRVASSTQQFQFLRDSQYDVINTAADNCVNYRINDNNPLGARMDVQMFAGLDHIAGLRLVARPGINTVEDLRGKTLSVDAPESGFAFVLYKIMRAHGLERGVDYQVVQTGGVFARFQGLLAGRFDGTLLSSGFELKAAAAGMNMFDDVFTVASPYLGSVFAARQSWMETHRDVVERLIRATYEASQWALDPANREEAIGLLTDQTTPRAVAEQIYETQVQMTVGNIRDLDMDRKGLLTVMQLREEYNGFDAPQNLHFLSTPASGLYDMSYRRAALRGLEEDQDEQ